MCRCHIGVPDPHGVGRFKTIALNIEASYKILLLRLWKLLQIPHDRKKYFPVVFVCCAIAGGLNERRGTGRGDLACASNKTRRVLGVCHVDVALIMLSNSSNRRKERATWRKGTPHSRGSHAPVLVRLRLRRMFPAASVLHGPGLANVYGHFTTRPLPRTINKDRRQTCFQRAPSMLHIGCGILDNNSWSIIFGYTNTHTYAHWE